MSAAKTIPEKELLPLLLLEHGEGKMVSGITRLQKLVFLAQNGGLSEDPIPEMGKDVEFEYVPHDYGPFSQELYDTLDKLHEKGLLNKSESRTKSGNTRYEFELTDKGEELLTDSSDEYSENDQNILEGIQIRYGDMPLFELLDKVYAEYPKYAKNSNLT